MSAHSTRHDEVRLPATHEDTQWMRAMVAARLEEVATRLSFLRPGTMVMSGITGPLPEPGTPKDADCDRCHAVGEVWLFRHCYRLDGVHVMLVGALCYTCSLAEGWEVER